MADFIYGQTNNYSLNPLKKLTHNSSKEIALQKPKKETKPFVQLDNVVPKTVTNRFFKPKNEFASQNYKKTQNRILNQKNGKSLIMSNFNSYLKNQEIQKYQLTSISKNSEKIQNEARASNKSINTIKIDNGASYNYSKNKEEKKSDIIFSKANKYKNTNCISKFSELGNILRTNADNIEIRQNKSKCNNSTYLNNSGYTNKNPKKQCIHHSKNNKNINSGKYTTSNFPNAYSTIQNIMDNQNKTFQLSIKETFSKKSQINIKKNIGNNKKEGKKEISFSPNDGMFTSPISNMRRKIYESYDNVNENGAKNNYTKYNNNNDTNLEVYDFTSTPEKSTNSINNKLSNNTAHSNHLNRFPSNFGRHNNLINLKKNVIDDNNSYLDDEHDNAESFLQKDSISVYSKKLNKKNSHTIEFECHNLNSQLNKNNNNYKPEKPILPSINKKKNCNKNKYISTSQINNNYLNINHKILTEDNNNISLNEINNKFIQRDGIVDYFYSGRNFIEDNKTKTYSHFPYPYKNKSKNKTIYRSPKFRKKDLSVNQNNNDENQLKSVNNNINNIVNNEIKVTKTDMRSKIKKNKMNILSSSPSRSKIFSKEKTGGKYIFSNQENDKTNNLIIRFEEENDDESSYFSKTKEKFKHLNSTINDQSNYNKYKISPKYLKDDVSSLNKYDNTSNQTSVIRQSKKPIHAYKSQDNIRGRSKSSLVYINAKKNIMINNNNTNSNNYNKLIHRYNINNQNLYINRNNFGFCCKKNYKFLPEFDTPETKKLQKDITYDDDNRKYFNENSYSNKFSESLNKYNSINKNSPPSENFGNNIIFENEDIIQIDPKNNQEQIIKVNSNLFGATYCNNFYRLSKSKNHNDNNKNNTNIICQVPYQRKTFIYKNNGNKRNTINDNNNNNIKYYIDKVIEENISSKKDQLKNDIAKMIENNILRNSKKFETTEEIFKKPSIIDDNDSNSYKLFSTTDIKNLKNTEELSSVTYDTMISPNNFNNYITKKNINNFKFSKFESKIYKKYLLKVCYMTKEVSLSKEIPQMKICYFTKYTKMKNNKLLETLTIFGKNIESSLDEDMFKSLSSDKNISLRKNKIVNNSLTNDSFGNINKEFSFSPFNNNLNELNSNKLNNKEYNIQVYEEEDDEKRQNDDYKLSIDEENEDNNNNIGTKLIKKNDNFDYLNDNIENETIDSNNNNKQKVTIGKEVLGDSNLNVNNKILGREISDKNLEKGISILEKIKIRRSSENKTSGNENKLSKNNYNNKNNIVLGAQKLEDIFNNKQKSYTYKGKINKNNSDKKNTENNIISISKFNDSERSSEKNINTIIDNKSKTFKSFNKENNVDKYKENNLDLLKTEKKSLEKGDQFSKINEIQNISIIDNKYIYSLDTIMDLNTKNKFCSKNNLLQEKIIKHFSELNKPITENKNDQEKFMTIIKRDKSFPSRKNNKRGGSVENKIKSMDSWGRKDVTKETKQAEKYIKELNLKMSNDDFEHEIIEILNIITMDNYKIILSKITNLLFGVLIQKNPKNKVNEEALLENQTVFVEKIIDKAIWEKGYAILYAKLCYDLFMNLMDIIDNYNDKYIKNLLINRENLCSILISECKIRLDEFCYDETIKLSNNKDEKNNENFLILKKQFIGVINFVAELINVKMLSLKNGFEFLELLNKRYSTEKKCNKIKYLNLEGIITLLNKFGKLVFNSQNEKHLQNLNDFINDKLINITNKNKNDNLPNYLKYKIINLIEKQKNNWKESLYEKSITAKGKNNDPLIEINNNIYNNENNVKSNSSNNNTIKTEIKNEQSNELLNKTSIDKNNNINEDLENKIMTSLSTDLDNYASFLISSNINSNFETIPDEINNNYNWAITEELITKLHAEIEEIIRCYIEICIDYISNSKKIFIANEYIKNVINYYIFDLSKFKKEMLHNKMIELLLNIDNYCVDNYNMFEITGYLLFILISNKLFYIKDLNNFIPKDKQTITNIAIVIKFTIIYSDKLKKRYFNDFKQSKLFLGNADIFEKYIYNPLKENFGLLLFNEDKKNK